MATGLISGYGRAGQRHGKILDELGIEWAFYDPKFLFNLSQVPTGITYKPLAEPTLTIATLKKYNFAVICSPPRFHLEQIKLCLEAGLPVLCEKPLCDLGQLDEARSIPLDAPVMIGFNYRYHPILRQVQDHEFDRLLLLCRQNRPGLPEWGLLLDHVSHDLDIINWLTGGYRVTKARHNIKQGKEEWIIRGLAGDRPVIIKESVANYYTRREAMLMYPGIQTVYIDPDPQMYTAMWRNFLKGNYYPGLAEAIETQELLEACNAIKN